MLLSGVSLNPVQIAYYVPDPEAAARRYARELGWGPFYLLEHIPLSRCHYRGRPAELDHSSAYGQAGSIMVELITQHGDAPSALRDLYRADQAGIHHVACFVPDLERALAQCRGRGLAVALEARTSTGVDFAMVDSSAELGHMIELYQPCEQLERFYALVRRSAHAWDGCDPVRRLGAGRGNTQHRGNA